MDVGGTHTSGRGMSNDNLAENYVLPTNKQGGGGGGGWDLITSPQKKAKNIKTTGFFVAGFGGGNI